MTDKIQRRIRWTTKDEIDFLDGLGTWRESHWNNRNLLVLRHPNEAVRKGLRLRYRASMALRKNWGEINPVDVFFSLSDLP